MSRLALEELEARCDQLQRRMHSESRHSSPSRQAGQSHARNMTPPATTNRRTATSAPMAHGSSSAAASGAGGAQQQLAAHEIAFAVSHLEKEKKRLEDELKLVNTHLVAYRTLMQQQGMPNVAAIATSSASSNGADALGRRGDLLSTSAATSVLASNPNASVTRQGNVIAASAGVGGGVAISVDRPLLHQSVETPMSSPVRTDRHLHSPAFRAANLSTAAATPMNQLDGSVSNVVPSSMHNDQIAAELHRIRRAREEREAQRRLSAAIASNGSPVRV